jgi:uncharacterized protein (TIGR03067 family)
MRAFALSVLLLAVAGLCRADDVDPEPPGGAAALRKLQGDWKLVGLSIDGGEVNSPPSLAVKVKGVTYSCPAGRATLKAVARPEGALDVTFVEGKSKGDRLECVFDVNGDTLRVCRLNGAKGRPGAVKAGRGAVVETYQRVK